MLVANDRNGVGNCRSAMRPNIAVRAAIAISRKRTLRSGGGNGGNEVDSGPPAAGVAPGKAEISLQRAGSWLDGVRQFLAQDLLHETDAGT